MKQLPLALDLISPWQLPNYGLDIDMATKHHHILAKCYDKKGRLLAAAFNSYTKTHPLMAYLARKVGHPERQFLHAEISAILKCKDKPIHRITIERYNANGHPATAKPCPICQLAIKMFNIPIVEHT